MMTATSYNDEDSLRQERAEQVLTELGVLQTGHFKLTSGRHSDKYMQCAKLFEHPKESEELCRLLAEAASALGEIDVVAGPAVGGIIMAYETAAALNARCIFAEREGGKMTLRRGFTITKGSRVFVVEDVVTTGGSVSEVVALLREAGADIVGVGAIVDRSCGMAQFDVPFIPLMKMEVISWEEDGCPLCRKGKPISKPGSRFTQ